MRPLMLLFLVFFQAVGLAAGDRKGIQPRPQVADHQTAETVAGGTVGVSLLSPQQVEQQFATELNRGYLVLELAFYPQSGKTITIEPDRFFLRSYNPEATLRPADPAAIARRLQKTDSADREVVLYPSVGIGYERGRHYDPNTGHETRGGGVTTSVGVGVGVGGSRSGASPDDRQVMELELSEKRLPRGPFSKPVSGFLYFPLPKQTDSLVLDFEIENEPVKVALP